MDYQTTREECMDYKLAHYGTVFNRACSDSQATSGTDLFVTTIWGHAPFALTFQALLSRRLELNFHLVFVPIF